MRAMTVTLKWTCPVCGGPRGEPFPSFPSFSYDGLPRLCCDGWINRCGHVDKYDDVRAEAAAGEADAAEDAEIAAYEAELDRRQAEHEADLDAAEAAAEAADSDPDYADWCAEYEADMVERALRERSGALVMNPMSGSAPPATSDPRSPAVAFVRNADVFARTLVQSATAADIAAVLRDVQNGRLIIADADSRAATSLRDAIAGELPPTQTNREAVATAIAYAVVGYLSSPAGRTLARDCRAVAHAAATEQTEV